MGRPTKLTDECRERVALAVRLGATYAHAARAGGIDRATFKRWMAKGATARSGPFCAFRAAVKKAESDALIAWLGRIEKAAESGTWQADAWKLERRYPRQYGRPEVQLAYAERDELEARLRALEQRAKEQGPHLHVRSSGGGY